jgi:hypothetical protein
LWGRLAELERIADERVNVSFPPSAAWIALPFRRGVALQLREMIVDARQAAEAIGPVAWTI